MVCLIIRLVMMPFPSTLNSYQPVGFPSTIPSSQSHWCALVYTDIASLSGKAICALAARSGGVSNGTVKPFTVEQLNRLHSI